MAVTRKDLDSLTRGSDNMVSEFGQSMDNNKNRKLQELLQGRQFEQQSQEKALDRNLTERALGIEANRDKARRSSEEANRRLQLMQLLGTAQKPLSQEKQKADILASEGLEASQRLQQMQAENPNATKAVEVADSLRSLPLVGGVAGGAVSGLANLFNPKTSQIDADREKIARNMLYLKSGASASEGEVAGTKRQLPGAMTRSADANERYKQFTAPFEKTVQANHAESGPAIDMNEAERYVRQGGAMPGRKAPQSPVAAAPQRGVATENSEKAELEALRKRFGK